MKSISKPWKLYKSDLFPLEKKANAAKIYSDFALTQLLSMNIPLTDCLSDLTSIPSNWKDAESQGKINCNFLRGVCTVDVIWT